MRRTILHFEHLLLLVVLFAALKRFSHNYRANRLLPRQRTLLN